jgi:hypothetical protein
MKLKKMKQKRKEVGVRGKAVEVEGERGIGGLIRLVQRTPYRSQCTEIPVMGYP